jgi:rhamnosyl/mannosyltransferase
VCTYHSDIVRQRFLGKLIGPVQDFAFRRAGAFVAASPAMMTASPVLKRYRDRCVVVPFGTDTKVSAALEGTSIDDVRQRFSGPITLAVGRLVSYKGFQHLIRAFAIAECPGTLLIVGDGPMDAALKAEIEALGLQGRAHLLGNVPDTAPYYQACDLFVLPSVGRNEAFGLVQLEAMICGKPVINTQLDSGVPFVSRHEETGLTVPPADEVALGAAITRLLSDEETRIRYGTAARSRVLSDFTAEKMIERTLAVYRRVASGSPGPARKQHLSFPVFARRGDTAN